MEDPVAVATMMARSMRGSEETSDEATSCNSGFMTPEQQPVSSPAPSHCNNPMAFGPAFYKRLDAEKTLLFETYPEVRTERDSAAYKKEFDMAYPRYLSLREKSNQRWFEMKRLHEQLQEALTHQLSSQHTLALQLSELSREARSHEVQDQELGLALLESKLRLLKTRIVDYNTSLGHDSYKRRKHSKH
ncbi:Elongation factor, RNA polymerase II, partial [Cichlidogyrus casuarinus]